MWRFVLALRRHILLPSSGSMTTYTGIHGVTFHKTVSSELTYITELTQEHFKSRNQTQWPTLISFWWRCKRVRYRKQGRVRQYCNREQVHTQVFLAVNSAMFAPWRRRVKGKLRTSSVGSLDYVMLYSSKLLPRPTNFWPTIILSCCVRKVARSDRHRGGGKNCFQLIEGKVLKGKAVTTDIPCQNYTFYSNLTDLKR